MSPKFALGLLLLCLVLLGLSDAQRPRQQQQQAPRPVARQGGNYRQGPKYRNSGGDGSFGTDINPPPLDAPGDCNQNNLAGNNRDRFKGRH